MKKLFISCPMNGRTEENVKKSMEKMHKLAEIIFDQELEVIPTWIDEEAPVGVNPIIWYLGKSISKLAEADYYIGIRYSNVFHGCMCENEAAHRYDIPRTWVDMDQIMPDAVVVERELMEAEYTAPALS